MANRNRHPDPFHRSALAHLPLYHAWKAQATLTTEDENLLDELHELARRLDDRMGTIERIIQADNPNWRAVGQDPVEAALEDRTTRNLRSDRIAEIGRTNRPVGRN